MYKSYSLKDRKNIILRKKVNYFIHKACNICKLCTYMNHGFGKQIQKESIKEFKKNTENWLLIDMFIYKK